MKKTIFLVVMFALISLNTISAKELEPKELVELANKEILDMGLYSGRYFELKNIKGKDLIESEHLKDTRNYIVYGEHHGDFKNGRYRYLVFPEKQG